VLRLQKVLRDSKLSLPLLALIGQQCACSLFHMNHVKLAGQSHDKCLHVFSQLVEFLSRPKKRSAGKPGAQSWHALTVLALFRHTHIGGYVSSFTHSDEVVEPDLQLLCNNFKMEIHFAFCVVRPTVAVVLDYRR